MEARIEIPFEEKLSGSGLSFKISCNTKEKGLRCDDEYIIFFCLEVFLKENDSLKKLRSEPKALIEIQIVAIPPFFSSKFGVFVDTQC